MPKDVKPRQLTKQLPGTEIAITVDGSGFLETVTPTNGWEGIVQGIGTGAAVKRTYIDLAGWSKEDLTTFVQGVDIQKMRTPLSDPGFSLIWEYDIISTRRIGLDEIVFFPIVPGFLGAPSSLDLMEVVYGQSRSYAVNGTITGTYITTDTGTFGTGDAVATDKLHWTRIIVFVQAGDDAQLEIYPSNLVIQAVTAKEKDLVWMERLRRSYVLQDQVDI